MSESKELPSPKFISVTKITLNAPEDVELFKQHLKATFQQVQEKRVKGLVEQPTTIIGGDRTYYTLSVWDSEDDMNNFRDSGAHANAMDAVPSLGNTQSLHWHSNKVPTREEVINKFEEENRKENKL